MYLLLLWGRRHAAPQCVTELQLGRALFHAVLLVLHSHPAGAVLHAALEVVQGLLEPPRARLRGKADELPFGQEDSSTFCLRDAAASVLVRNTALLARAQRIVHDPLVLPALLNALVSREAREATLGRAVLGEVFPGLA